MEQTRFTPQEIKELRKFAKMTLKELGRYLGVDMGTVHRWEQAKARPSQLANRQLHRLLKKVNSK